jgi:hypothetical protein
VKRRSCRRALGSFKSLIARRGAADAAPSLRHMPYCFDLKSSRQVRVPSVRVRKSAPITERAHSGNTNLLARDQSDRVTPEMSHGHPTRTPLALSVPQVFSRKSADHQPGSVRVQLRARDSRCARATHTTKQPPHARATPQLILGIIKREFAIDCVPKLCP